MAKRKPSAALEETALQVPEEEQAATPAAETTPVSTAAAPEGVAASAPVQAPPKGEGRSYTIDNRLGYRKEDSPDGRRRQIRFADREGGQRPDDEILATVREAKPDVSWSSREKAWQARKTPEGLEALDSADQKLAEVGRRRTSSHER